MNILAIDTAANLCAACVYDSAESRVAARRSADIGTGHAELLMDLIGEALEEAALSYRDVGAIVVSVGPGSFTGVRIGVAAARGLALALKIPAIGVSTLEALAFEARETHPGRSVLAAIDAKRDEIYVSLHGRDGAVLVEPRLADLETARRLAVENDAILAGSAAEFVAVGGKLTIASRARTADIATYAKAAAVTESSGTRPKPLYLRSVDAKPQQNFALPHKGAAV